MDDVRSYSTNSSFHDWMDNIQMLFQSGRFFHIKVLHHHLLSAYESGGYTYRKHFSVAIHHKIIVRITITRELVKMNNILLRWMWMTQHPLFKPILTFQRNVFVVQRGRRPYMRMIR